jgi:signal transduction histidine kinase/CheY-like chemotaxis protein
MYHSLFDTDLYLQETTKLQPDQHQRETCPFLIVNDLKQEDRFRRLPFVEGEPYARFYAGTPLTSDRNINLGCLFILDPEPREGLSNDEKDTLGTVAAMVMEYLQVSRQAMEGRRASRLSHGLRLFVDGNSSFANNIAMSHSHSSNHSPSLPVSPYRMASRSSSSLNSDLNIRSAQSDNEDSPLQNGDPQSLSPVSSEELDLCIPASPAPSSHSSRQSDDNSTVSSNHDWLFQRAANLLRQSLDLRGAGGVVLLKARDDPADSVAGGHCFSADPKSLSPVLALSTRDDPFSYQAGSETSYPAANLDNVFLNQLCRRYPKGRLWSFHHDGTLSTSDEEQSVGTPPKQNKKSRATEATKLNAYFPDACQVMFVPLWNATNLQWFGGCFSWTPQPTRVFSRAVDLSSMFGFSSSIMIEYTRVESITADRQKGDFISCISHELRSPLHGVLAAAEFLGSTSMDSFQESLLETVNACGRTLLDTMNQVLDFGKLLLLERHEKRLKHRKDPSMPKSRDKDSVRLDPSVPTNLAILTEDVVDSVCLGHFHIQSTLINNATGVSPTSSLKPATEGNKVGTSPDVEVVVDISYNNWLYKAYPGSLRRLIMNLLGNSLKYTKKGLISVSIKATEHSKGCSRDQGCEDTVTLTVSDTGEGISSEYLQKRLYTPFAQEDTLSPGTGLGLSIVRGIVETLNGDIKIQSRVGEGTTVTVTFPLEHPAEETSLPSTLHFKHSKKGPSTASSQLYQLDLTGKCAAILGVEFSCLYQYPFWSSIARYITDWFGLTLVPWSANEHIDVVFANESDLMAEGFQHTRTASPNMIIFRNVTGGSSDGRVQWSHLADSLVILPRPCGPQKLARGLLNCLYSEPASATPRSPAAGRTFVIPERPKSSHPTPPAERSTLPSFKNLEPMAAESPHSMPVSGSFVTFVAERDVSIESPDAESSVRTRAASIAHAPSTSSPRGSTLVDSASGTQSRPRVLLVDDNDINLRLIMTLMKKRKITTIDTAQNGKEAVNSAKRMMPGYDLIFMDMSMPIMDGFEATRAIRAIERNRDGCVPAKIIAFTGLSSSRDKSRALESGVDLFLTKPASLKEISRLVDEWKKIC